MKLNREDWLNLVSKTLVLPLLKMKGGKVDYTYRVSVGWPKGSRGGKGGESIGQCWATSVSADKVHEIFVSPRLDAPQAIAVLIHEHIHASVGLKCKHKGKFKELALAVGFVGKMTETPCGEELEAKIIDWLKDLPKYPHGVMSIDKKEKKPGSRLLKAACEECGYTVRLAQSWLNVASPVCPDPDCDNHGEAMSHD